MYDAIIFTDNTDEIQISLPLGGFKIASVLRKNGYPTLVVNHLSTFTADEIKKLVDLVVTEQTKIVGFSTTFFRDVESDSDGSHLGFDTVFPQGKAFEDEILTYIKTKNNNVKFVAGGTKTYPKYENTNIDYVFMGYSETSIIDLLRHLTTSSSLPNSYLNENGIVIVDDKKALSYNFTRDKMIWEKTDIVNHQVLPIEIGRGCIFRCKFCSYPLNGKKNLDYIKQTEIIYQELLDNYTRFGITHYFIVDDTFNDHIDKLKAIESAVKRLSFQPKFWCYARLDLLCTNEGMLDVLYRIGVRAMYFGIETLNLSTGRLIGKGYDRQKQIAMIRYIRDTYPDMALHGSFIAGLPKESVNSIQQTCDQLATGQIPLHSWMIKAFVIFKNDETAFNSELDINYDKYGYTIESEYQNMLIWKNEETTMLAAHDIATKCISDSRTKDYFCVPGHDSFEMVNFGYDQRETMRTSFKDFKWDIIKSGVVSDFIANYKSQLFEILNAQVAELVDAQR
jgi:radical SAM superfamily enzyme YgiQ (UPF0313 family)